MAKQILTTLDLLALPSLTTPKAGSVGFGAKTDGLYQKVGTVETKLSTTAELLDRVKKAVPSNAVFTDTNTTYTAGTNVQISAANVISATDTKYSLPTASGTVLGGVKVGSRLSISSGTLSANVQSDNNFTTALKNKLDNIASNANNYSHPSTHPASMITGLHSSATTGVAGSVAWGNVTGKPDTFAPTTHTHSNITITAGTGLSGGGALSASRTLSIASTYAPNTSTSLGASKNLNNYQTAGFYHQTSNANATTALNYPVASAGALLVETAAGVIQTYKVYNSSNVYVRGYYGTTWTAWRKLVNASDSIPWARISGAPTTATTHPTWAQVTGKPATFTPSSHTHTSAQISDATNLNTASMIVKRDSSGNFSAGTITATLSGNASSATKLATTRAINGTNFNGSAAITTAHWGTARTLSFTGDVIGSSSVNGSKNVATAMTLANSGVTAGTYRSVTVDVKGRVTAGTNPTTLAGYGITDAVTTNTTQSITGTKTFTKRIGANLGVKIGTHSTDGLIEWDATNNAFKFNGSVYATGGISALGLGEGGGSSGGGGADMLDSWANYTTAKANYYIPASLGIGLYNDKADKSNFQVVTSLPTLPTAGVFYFIKE